MTGTPKEVFPQWSHDQPVTIGVKAKFVKKLVAGPGFHDQEAKGRAAAKWLWCYEITFVNRSDEPVTLRGRHWRIEGGSTEELQGRTVAGEFTTLPPGELYRYRSYVPLNDIRGSMAGYFLATRGASKELIKLVCPSFTLEAPLEPLTESVCPATGEQKRGVLDALTTAGFFTDEPCTVDARRFTDRTLRESFNAICAEHLMEWGANTFKSSSRLIAGQTLELSDLLVLGDENTDGDFGLVLANKSFVPKEWRDLHKRIPRDESNYLVARSRECVILSDVDKHNKNIRKAVDRLFSELDLIGDQAEALRAQIEPAIAAVLGEPLRPDSDHRQTSAPTVLPDKAPKLYADRPKGQNIIDFLRDPEGWGPYIKAGLLTRHEFRRFDPQAYMALANWLRDPNHILPPDVEIPTKRELTDRAAARAPSAAERPARVDWALRNRAHRARQFTNI
jgi:ApaG protein